MTASAVLLVSPVTVCNTVQSVVVFGEATFDPSKVKSFGESTLPLLFFKIKYLIVCAVPRSIASHWGEAGVGAALEAQA
ncbi:MAG: hypothetical protein BWY21_00724 [Parcubacteria group bacterium ADurb.Bin216]|nr:MAG: hypothetical protein BWY21_00724 [Parcubacteria group bacterium ADurb.Bin216]